MNEPTLENAMALLYRYERNALGVPDIDRHARKLRKAYAEAQEAEQVDRDCPTCRYDGVDDDSEPCASCYIEDDAPKWQPSPTPAAPIEPLENLVGYTSMADNELLVKLALYVNRLIENQRKLIAAQNGGK